MASRRGHRLVVGVDHVDRRGLRRLLVRLGRDHAGLALLRLLQLDGELVLHLAQRGEVLVELHLVGAADAGHQRLALVGDGRSTLWRSMIARVRLPVRAVRVLEALAEQAGVERDRRGLRRREAAAGAGRIADRLAGRRNLDRLEARADADRVGDPGVERRAVHAAARAQGRAPDRIEAWPLQCTAFGRPSPMTRKPENTETLSFTGVRDVSSGVIS